jgi:hypothetical protein
MITEKQLRGREVLLNLINSNKRNKVSPIQPYDNFENTESDISENTNSDISENTNSDISENTESVISENTNSDISENTNSDISEEEIRVSDYTYEYSNTQERRRNRQLESIKQRARELFVEKCNIEETIHNTKLTYDDIIESYLYHKD